jgi:predicted DNA-binding transcriptional regulator AlpA
MAYKKDQTPATERPWLGKRAAASFCGISVSTLDRLRKRGLFPAGRQIIPGRVVWGREDLLAWLAARPSVDSMLGPEPTAADGQSVSAHSPMGRLAAQRRANRAADTA